MIEKIKNFHSVMLYVTGIVVVFFLINAIAYLLGYWGTFDINAFDFGSIYDVARTSFPNVFYSFLLFLPIFLIMAVGKSAGSEKGVENKGLPRHFYFACFPILFVLVLLFLVVLYFYRLPFTGLFVFVFCAVMFFVLFDVLNFEKSFLVDLVPNNKVRFIIFIVFIFSPVFTFDKGYNDALIILKGNNYKCVHQLHVKGRLLYTPGDSLKYLGRLGDSILLMSQDNSSTYIVGLDKLDFIKLSTCKKGIGDKIRKTFSNEPKWFQQFLSRSFRALIGWGRF